MSILVVTWGILFRSIALLIALLLFIVSGHFFLVGVSLRNDGRTLFRKK